MAEHVFQSSGFGDSKIATPSTRSPSRADDLRTASPSTRPPSQADSRSSCFEFSSTGSRHRPKSSLGLRPRVLHLQSNSPEPGYLQECRSHSSRGGQLRSSEQEVPKRPFEKQPRRPGSHFRRKQLCNLGPIIGEKSLITVVSGCDVIRAPYDVTVRYDLMPESRKITSEDHVFLAALDVKKLRRKGAGIGLDAVQVSGNWIARDCICTKSGRLKKMAQRSGPGQMCITLSTQAMIVEAGEACVMLRVIASRHPEDMKDWQPIGAPVVLRVDAVGKLLQQEPPEKQRHRGIVASSADAPETSATSCAGVRVQQLIDFRDEIYEDMQAYCQVHRECVAEGKYKSHHVCLHTPCPFRPLNFPKCDDHRSQPFVARTALPLELEESLEPLRADSHLVVGRYLKPMTKGTGNGHAVLMNQNKPLRPTVFVSHAWSEPFSDFVDTLSGALDKDDVVFVASFSVDQHCASAKAPLGSAAAEGWMPEVLRSVDKVLLVVDETFAFTKRLWCNYEILKAKAVLTPTVVWPHSRVDLQRLRAAVGEVSLRGSVTSTMQDDEHIRAVLRREAEKGEDQNELLREFLERRVDILAKVMHQASERTDASAEKLRLLYAEYERRVTLEEMTEEAKRRLARKNIETACLALAKKMDSDKHAKEAVNFQRMLANLNHEFEHEREKSKQELAKLLNHKNKSVRELQEALENTDAAIVRTETSLHEHRADAELRGLELEDLEHSILDETERVSAEARRVEETMRQVEEEKERRRAEEKRVSTLQRTCADMEDSALHAEAMLSKRQEYFRAVSKRQQEELANLQAQLSAARNPEESHGRDIDIQSDDGVVQRVEEMRRRSHHRETDESVIVTRLHTDPESGGKSTSSRGSRVAFNLSNPLHSWALSSTFRHAVPRAAGATAAAAVGFTAHQVAAAASGAAEVATNVTSHVAEVAGAAAGVATKGMVEAVQGVGATAGAVVEVAQGMGAAAGAVATGAAHGVGEAVGAVAVGAAQGMAEAAYGVGSAAEAAAEAAAQTGKKIAQFGKQLLNPRLLPRSSTAPSA